MIKLSNLKATVESQKKVLEEKETGLIRELLTDLSIDTNHALIISGIRRCGKSTLLNQLIKKEQSDAFFINFDTPKLYNFELTNFELLDILIEESGNKILYFDEIQVVDGWELYIRQKLDQNYSIVITGSNATLLSKELGTKLTGRHITKELFPFSFSEFVRFRSATANENIFSQYISQGGFPEYLKTGNPDILPALLDDILYRDIAVRYNIRNVKTLKRLLVFLISNVGNLITASKLRQILGIKSTATILDYFSYFEQSYLLALLPKFSYSYRAQIVNPRKIYFIDNGMINAASASFSDDIGHKLENIIYTELRRQYKELYYYNENGHECDFVVCKNSRVINLIQVCYLLSPENIDRETTALFDAMTFFKKSFGVIITFNQQDFIIHQGKKIEVLPAYKFLLKSQLWTSQ